MSPIGIGSDVAISLRGPAAFTGIAALKATPRTYSLTRATFPPFSSRWWHVGPMARTVRDVALGYSILSGPDGTDGYAVHAKVAEPGDGRFAGQTIRVGWVSDSAFGPVDPEITRRDQSCRGATRRIWDVRWRRSVCPSSVIHSQR